MFKRWSDCPDSVLQCDPCKDCTLPPIWPELSTVTLDVYVCNFGADHSAKVQALMNALLALFNPAHITRHALQRGQALLTTSEKVIS